MIYYFLKNFNNQFFIDILLCSKREVEKFSDLSNEEIFDYSLTLQDLVKRIELYREANSCTISIQDGENCGQKINHFHVHIIPRYQGDFENNNDIYDKIKSFDDEFIKQFQDFMSDDKKKNELKAEVENIKNFMNKLYLY